MAPCRVHLLLSAAAAVPFLLLLCCSEKGEAKPLFGAAFLGPFLGGFNSTTANTSSLLTALALNHLQHKIDALAQFGELFGLGGTANDTFFLS